MSWSLSDGEIHFLWWFIQGSIMNPGTRQHLRQTWGFCQRHACGFLAIECAFRHGRPHGAALLYEDLMERARDAFRGYLRPGALVAYRLRERRPCLLCELQIGSQSAGAAGSEILERGRDLGEVRAFAEQTRGYWEACVCDRCLGRSWIFRRCRPHLIASLRHGDPVDLEREAAFVDALLEHVRRYARAFRWEQRGTDTVEDHAALISALGWCSGWGEWLRLVGSSTGSFLRADEPPSRGT